MLNNIGANTLPCGSPFRCGRQRLFFKFSTTKKRLLSSMVLIRSARCTSRKKVRSALSGPTDWILRYRPLSRRLDRCDRVIHNESGDPNGGNMCSFSGATCTSRDVTMQITFLTRKSALIYRRDLRQRVASLTLNCNGVLAIRAYIKKTTFTFTSPVISSTLPRRRWWLTVS